jgi:hypothetical protein
MLRESTQSIDLESLPHPLKNILLIRLAQRTSLGSMAGEPTRIFFANDLMPVVIPTMGLSVLVNDDGNPLFHRVTK